MSIYRESTDLDDSFAAIKRTCVCCTQDQAVVPSIGNAIVADMNAAWSSSPTALLVIEAFHAVMFSKPVELANMPVKSV